MHVRICHVTRYNYDQRLAYSVQALRLTPPSFSGQRVLSWTIDAPGIANAISFKDAFGNVAQLVSATGLEGEVLCKAEGLVETEDQAGIVKGLTETAPLRVYMRSTPLTHINDPIRALGAIIGQTRLLDGLHKLMHAVRDAVDYKIGVSHSETTAADALAARQGVCQDHAHIFVAAARSAGVPARYVNGYFLSGAGEAAEAHHAWAEAWVEGLGWVGFDPANRICPTDHYVRLAVGLDARYAAPVRGSRRGGTNEALDVSVEVQQASIQQ